MQQITTGDSNVVKNLLDDHAYEHLTNIGRYIEDHRLGNVKLALMGMSCVVASIAQFYEDRHLVGIPSQQNAALHLRGLVS